MVRDHVDYKVTQQRTRARRAGLPATLSNEEWANTLKYFNGKCAYCLVGRYHVIEHFKPIKQGGGTTKNNCVPACYSCNSCKLRADRVFLGSAQNAERALTRVKAYLDGL